MLIGLAYNLKLYQMTNGGLNTSNQGITFDIDAIVAAGTTAEGLLAMERELLRTRFGLILHFEDKQVEGFSLVAASKKLKMSSASPEPEQASTEPGPFHGYPGPPTIDKDGFPIIANTRRPYLVAMNDKVRWVAWNEPMHAIVDMLEGQLGQPVTDSTGVAGRYDFDLKWGSQRRQRGINSLDNVQTDDTPSLFEAIQDQLGLKLVANRVRISVPVVDHIEKFPTPN